MANLPNLNFSVFLASKGKIEYNAMDISGMTGFHWACEKGHMGVVEKLVSYPDLVDLGAKDNHGRNGFLWASWSGKVDVMSLLFNCKLPVVQESLNVKDKDGNNAYHLVCRECDEEAVMVLLTEGKDKIDFMALNNKMENGWVTLQHRNWWVWSGYFGEVIEEYRPDLKYFPKEWEELQE